LLVDDDTTSGRTLGLALDHLSQEGVEIRIATLRVLKESNPAPDFFSEDKRGSVFRHQRFPWIKHSPEYRRYARLREQMESWNVVS
jgi:hypoxanthine phosphoribosyltransferase